MHVQSYCFGHDVVVVVVVVVAEGPKLFLEPEWDCWLRGHECERNNCFSQLVGQNYRDKTT